MRGRWSQYGVLLTCLAGAWLCGTATWSQSGAQVGREYCNVTDVDVKQLSNAVRVSIRCDGSVEPFVPLWQYVAFDSKTDGITGVTPSRQILVYLTNAKSKAGTLINVGRYPVSHVQLTPFPDSPDGVGLTCTLALYAEATLLETALPGWHIHDWELVGAGFGPQPGQIRFIVQESDDKRGVEILVTSDRFPVQGLAGDVVETTEQSALQVTAEADQVVLHAVHARFQDVLEALSERTGVNIVAEDGVKRTVSAHLEAGSAEEIVRALARVEGMAVTPSERGFVLSGSTAQDVPSYGGAETRRITLEHIRADEAMRLLPVFLYPYVREDMRTNSLVVTGPGALVDKVAADLSKIDEPPKEIEVTVQVLAYFGDKNLTYELGLRGQGAGAVGDLGPQGDLSGAISVVGGVPQDIEARVSALRHAGTLRARTREMIRVTNGQSGDVFVGAQPTIVTSYFDMWTASTRPELQVIDVGARLEVKPWTGDGSSITVRVAPSVTSIRGVDPVTNLPILNVRGCEASVRVRNAESLVLAGLEMSQQGRTDSGSDWLGDLPGLDAIFGGRHEYASRAEIGFIVTPRVV